MRKHVFALHTLQECEGLQAILIDWQGGFLGSVANDLMWALYPFLEANPDDRVKLLHKSFYCQCSNIIFSYVIVQSTFLIQYKLFWNIFSTTKMSVFYFLLLNSENVQRCHRILLRDAEERSRRFSPDPGRPEPAD